MDIRDLIRPLAQYFLPIGYGESGSYSVGWTAPTTNPTLGNGTLVGRYTKRGNMCLASILLIFGSTTNGGSGNWSFSLPFKAKDNSGISFFGLAHVRDAATNNYDRVAQIIPATDPNNVSVFNQMDNATNVSNLAAAAPFSFGTGDSVSIQVEFEME